MMTKTDLLPYKTFQAKNNITINIRPIRPDDTNYLIEIFEHMSSESRYSRFNQVIDHVTESRKWDVAQTIATADPKTNFGLLAFADLPSEPDPPIGAARYVKLSETEAEFAISIRDDYHNLGIGTFLLSELTQHAVEHGITTLVAGIQNSNKSIWFIINKLPYRVIRYVDGNESNIEIDLTQPQEPEL